MKKEELEIIRDPYVEKLRDVEQKISDLRKEKESIVNELILRHCPFKVGDCISVTDQGVNRGRPRYGKIKAIYYNIDHHRFIYNVYYINKQTKVINDQGQIYCSERSIIEKYD